MAWFTHVACFITGVSLLLFLGFFSPLPFIRVVHRTIFTLTRLNVMIFVAGREIFFCRWVHTDQYSHFRKACRFRVFEIEMFFTFSCITRFKMFSPLRRRQLVSWRLNTGLIIDSSWELLLYLSVHSILIYLSVPGTSTILPSPANPTAPPPPSHCNPLPVNFVRLKQKANPVWVRMKRASSSSLISISKH